MTKHITRSPFAFFMCAPTRYWGAGDHDVSFLWDETIDVDRRGVSFIVLSFLYCSPWVIVIPSAGLEGWGNGKETGKPIKGILDLPSYFILAHSQETAWQCDHWSVCFEFQEEPCFKLYFAASYFRYGLVFYPGMNMKLHPLWIEGGGGIICLVVEVMSFWTTYEEDPLQLPGGSPNQVLTPKVSSIEASSISEGEYASLWGMRGSLLTDAPTPISNPEKTKMSKTPVVYIILPFVINTHQAVHI